MEVWIAASVCVGKERELRDTENVSVYVLDILLPHGSGAVIKYPELQAGPVVRHRVDILGGVVFTIRANLSQNLRIWSYLSLARRGP
ncbi:hypothetical protein EVJ58_g3694 [Rhodofomes roseus]|uniref:Uncharacterized protein n=1 Tax=Rhodofomes roseus TaxID=34475 RepID=A0A4Y9YKQ8_9APHY|nr:hypothetical protein EVJ58_g3694 [Rhodofomes roseus]